LITVLVIAVSAFAATNVDGMLVLIGFFSDPRVRDRHVVVGEFLGMAALVLASLACALTARALPEDWIGLFGLVPIALGVQRLMALFRGQPEEDSLLQPARGGVLPVAAVTVSNGGDNFSTYAPLFASMSAPQLCATVLVFAAMAGLWCFAARALVTRPRLGRSVRRWGPRLLPFVLIALGIRILAATGWLGGIF
jgi:cadmium resistance protein CadD (predicted permease)